MNETTLTLYYYNDGLSEAERLQVAVALAADEGLAKRYRVLCDELQGIEDVAVAPPADMVRRWHEGLDRAAGKERQAAAKPAVHSWSFLLGAAVTAALAIGIGIGMFVGGNESPAPIITEPLADAGLPPDGTSTAFLRGLQVYLRESEQGLAALPVGVGTDRSMMIMNIIGQNRIFERAAMQNDAENLARVLRAFELVLIELAADDVSAAEADALRAKLLFELNVMLTKLSRDTSDEQQSI